jgi:intracellular sulfur oxidation DsrE/DsrF family protein
MTLKKMIVGLAVATTMAASSAWASGPQDRMVIQVSDGDPAKWNLALNNARNAFSDLGKDNIQIEIVAYGPGIGMLKMDAVTASRVEEAIKSGISIVACENTLTAQKLDKEDMNDAISYVPAGVVQLMRRQQEGWAYIRP